MNGRRWRENCTGNLYVFDFYLMWTPRCVISADLANFCLYIHTETIRITSSINTYFLRLWATIFFLLFVRSLQNRRFNFCLLQFLSINLDASSVWFFSRSFQMILTVRCVRCFKCAIIPEGKSMLNILAFVCFDSVNQRNVFSSSMFTLLVRLFKHGKNRMPRTFRR